MMNQSYGPAYGNNRSACNRCGADYNHDHGRRPVGSSPRTIQNGGCGCGLNRGRTAPVMNRDGGCGCGTCENRESRENRENCGTCENCGNCGNRENRENCENRENRGNRGNCGNCENRGDRGDRRGCCNGQNESCKRLSEQIRAVDFALWETVLYLDVYPHSCDALETYHKLKSQSEALRREYEALCGPMSATGNQSTTSWDWMSKPFPWEYDAD